MEYASEKKRLEEEVNEHGAPAPPPARLLPCALALLIRMPTSGALAQGSPCTSSRER